MLVLKSCLSDLRDLQVLNAKIDVPITINHGIINPVVMRSFFSLGVIFLANVSVHQIRPTQRTSTTSTTFPLPINKLPTSAVGFGWHVLFDTIQLECAALNIVLTKRTYFSLFVLMKNRVAPFKTMKRKYPAPIVFMDLIIAKRSPLAVSASTV